MLVYWSLLVSHTDQAVENELDQAGRPVKDHQTSLGRFKQVFQQSTQVIWLSSSFTITYSIYFYSQAQFLKRVQFFRPKILLSSRKTVVVWCKQA